MFYTTKYISPVGEMTLASDESGKNLVGLWIEGQKYYQRTIFGDFQEEGAPIFVKTKEWLQDYFAGGNPDISKLSLAHSGSEFQKDAWDILCKIPYGKVTTYKDVSKKNSD